MEENIWKLKKILRQQKRRRYWRKAVSAFAVVVVFCTTYALILPAITMEKTTNCGKEEHQHSASCYTQELICEKTENEDGSEHIHSNQCYKNVLTCHREEHTHNKDCYPDENTAATANKEEAQSSEKEQQTSTTAKEQAETTAEKSVLQASGDTYKVTVTYDESAGIPQGAVLEVNEYAQDSKEYQDCFKEANDFLLDQDDSCIRLARFFDISIMDGKKEIEPKNLVEVEISQSSDITEDIIITHATEKGTEVIPEVKLTQEDDGYVTASFEAESFSDYGTISAGESQTIGIGDTVTLTGASSNKNEWSVSPEGYVTLEEDGNNAVVTGVAAGTVTITHQYKNNKSETFTVIVTDTGSSGGEDDVEKEANKTGYKVTVKGNKKILQDAELYVEEISPTDNDDYYTTMVGDIDSSLSTDVNDKDSIFAFLKMYHIYLSKDGGKTEYDPTVDDTNINLQVTITYDQAPEGWPSGKGNVYVGHYKKNGSKIENKGFTDTSGIKRISVSGNSVTFHIKSFSVLTLTTLTEAQDSTTTIEPGADGTYDTSLAQTAKNDWQIVSGRYEGNVPNNKTLSDDALVRVQKNVVPTDTENEFFIYLSMDKKVSWEEIIQSANLLVTTSGSYKKIGEVYDSIHGNSGEVSPIYSSSAKNEYTATVTLTRNGTAIKTITQTYYGTVPNCSNATGFLELTINRQTKYVTASTSVNLHEDGSGSGGALTYTVPLESLESKFDFADFTVDYDGISDVMGDYIKFDSKFTPTGNYEESPSYDSDKKTLSWIPVQKDGLVATYTNNTEKTTGWYLNSAELVYKIKLDVTKDGFQSVADYLTSSDESKDHPYSTNQLTSLSYHWAGEDANARSTDFVSPKVRGLLYDVVFNKVDADDNTKGVESAQFTLTDGEGVAKGSISTNKNQTQYEIATGLPYGSYTLTETPPSNYTAVGGTTRTVNLCYTDSPDSLAQCETDQSDMRNTGSDQGVLTIENQKKEITIVLKKTDMNSQPLSGAQFKIYDQDKKELDKGLIASGEDGVFSPESFCLEPGTYYLEETQTPDGYHKPSGMFKLEITSESISVFNYDSEVEGNYSGTSVKSFPVTDNQAEVVIYNSTGTELPSTGGSGTLPYTFGGLGLILISVLMYGYRMRRRQERRLM